ncbi:hypothetical protein MTR_6g077970 [Medicago truncatula]|uniref:Uncharacterized protein n=1 Tax=Medicago truncatula TaxID=3880 RepID=G7KKC7_MEDTR|nr:hypothetical protein MTR_6g077970 [Medicago truncatula]
MKESIGEMVRVTLRRVKFVCGGRSRPVLWGEQTAQSDEPQEKKDVKPPKIEAKPNIDGAFVHVEASKYVGGSGVLPLQAHEVDTARFFSDDVKSKDRE